MPFVGKCSTRETKLSSILTKGNKFCLHFINYWSPLNLKFALNLKLKFRCQRKILLWVSAKTSAGQDKWFSWNSKNFDQATAGQMLTSWWNRKCRKTTVCVSVCVRVWVGACVCVHLWVCVWVNVSVRAEVPVRKREGDYVCACMCFTPKACVRVAIEN